MFSTKNICTKIKVCLILNTARHEKQKFLDPLVLGLDLPIFDQSWGVERAKITKVSKKMGYFTLLGGRSYYDAGGSFFTDLGIPVVLHAHITGERIWIPPPSGLFFQNTS